MDNQVLKESLESLVKRVMLDLLAHKVFQDLTVLLWVLQLINTGNPKNHASHKLFYSTYVNTIVFYIEIEGQVYWHTEANNSGTQ